MRPSRPIRLFKDLSVRAKLAAVFFAVAIIIVGVALVGYLGIASLNAGTATMYADRLLPAQQLGSFNEHQLGIGTDLYRAILFPAERAERERDITALVAAADASLVQYEATYLVPDEVAGLARLKPAWAAYQEAVAQVIRLADAGDLAGALDAVAEGGPVSADETVVSQIVTDLIDVQVRVGVSIKQQAAGTSDLATLALVLACLAGTLLAIGLAFVMGRSISAPLSRITEAARDVAAGRLSEPRLTDIRSRDEIGVLARTFDFMTGRLRDTLDELRRSEERYRAVYADTPSTYFTLDEAGTVLSVNTFGVDQLGYSTEELVGGSVLRVFPEDQRAEAAAHVAECVANPGQVRNWELRKVRKDGSELYARETGRAVPGPRGEVLVLVVSEDVSERRTIEEELLQAQKMESIGRLAGGVAHHLNNLLTVILGNAELARLDLPAGHPARSSVDEIVKAGDGAAGLTRELLAFASKQIVSPVRLDLGAVVAGSEEMLRRLLGEDIELITVLGPSLDMIEADPGQLQHLLIALALNARDAMPDGGKLVIETANETVGDEYAANHPGVSAWRYVRLSVADTGLGMSDEVRQHVFEPFFTTKDVGEGTGLGLASCRGIVRQIGGDISVSSGPGQGTTFRIMLPAVDAPAASSSGAAPAVPTSTGGATVLVVEDEPSQRRMAVLVLRAQGYTVLEAADGVEALEIAGRAPGIDLLVSDVGMPGMSGPGLVERLHEQSPATRVLLISGHAEATGLPLDFAARDLGFLPKPFTPERLARKVREILDAEVAFREASAILGANGTGIPARREDSLAQEGGCVSGMRAGPAGGATACLLPADTEGATRSPGAPESGASEHEAMTR